MAVDTEQKRRQSIAVRTWWFRRVLPVADGTIDRADRQMVARHYDGGTDVEPPDPDPFPYTMTWNVPTRATFDIDARGTYNIDASATWELV